MYEELEKQNNNTVKLLSTYQSKCQRLETYVGHVVHTLTDLGSMYKTVVRQEKASNSRFGFTLQGKFYEIDENEHLTLIQGNQGLVIFHLLIKHISQDHLPHLDSVGYCMPGNRAPNDTREKLPEETIHMLTQDTKQFVPLFRTKDSKQLRKWLGETLSELNNERLGKPRHSSKRKRIASPEEESDE